MTDLMDNPTVKPVEAESPYDDLRQLHKKLAGNRHKNIAVAGYGGKLVARYRVLEWAEKREISQKLLKAADEGDDDAAFHQYVDELIAACTGIYRRRRDDGKLEKIEDGWYLDLADKLGYPAETAREVVVGAFRNDEALNAHHDVWRAWVRTNGDGLGALDDVDDEFLGE